MRVWHSTIMPCISNKGRCQRFVVGQQLKIQLFLRALQPYSAELDPVHQVYQDLWMSVQSLISFAKLNLSSTQKTIHSQIMLSQPGTIFSNIGTIQNGTLQIYQGQTPSPVHSTCYENGESTPVFCPTKRQRAVTYDSDED